MVAAYEELASGVDISTLKPDEITAYISNYLEEHNVDTSGLTPDGLTAFVLAYQEADGGALTTALTPDGITAMVAKYLEAEDVDISALSPDQVEAIVSAFAEATGCDKSQLLQDFTAYIARYDDSNAVKPTLSMSVGIYGYDLMAYRKFIAENPVEVQGIVKLGEVYENPEEALLDPQTKFWQDGQQIPVEAVPTELLTADKVAVLDEDGTLHVLIAPDVTGAQEAIDSLRTEVAEVDQLGVTALGKATGLLPETSLDMIESALSRLQSYQETLDYNWWDKFWAGVFGASTDKGTLDTSMKLDFPAERVAELSTYVGEIVAAIQQGQEVKQEDLDNLQTILTFLQELDTSEVGTHILEGVGEGMTAAGWDSDAETVASNLEAALNLALGIQSPSTRVKPVGANVSAGVGEGMKTYDFSSDASLLATAIEAAVAGALPATALEPTGTAAVQGLAKAMTGYSMSGTGSAIAASVRSSVNNSLNSGTLRSAGVNAMAGLKAGINAGRSGVISAMRSAARAAISAAKSELKIKSPSKVFEEEVGVMVMRGLGQGVLKESREQARVIRNAARYLTGEAKAGSIQTTSNDNRRTYNNSVHSTIQVQQMVVRDEQDIRALAVEIAALTRRQQRGKAMRKGKDGSKSARGLRKLILTFRRMRAIDTIPKRRRTRICHIFRSRYSPKRPATSKRCWRHLTSRWKRVHRMRSLSGTRSTIGTRPWARKATGATPTPGGTGGRSAGAGAACFGCVRARAAIQRRWIAGTVISSIRPIAATRRWSRTAIFRRERRRSGRRRACGKWSWKEISPARTRTSSTYGSRSTIWSATATRRPSSAVSRRSARMPSSRRRVNGMDRGAWAGLPWTTPPTRA